MIPLIVASTNRHKIGEIAAILAGQAEVFGLEHFPDYVAPEETGTTFLENAQIKAQSLVNFFKSQNCKTIPSNSWILADDSGLVCDDLNGAPGIFSARFAGEKASDADNRKKLISSFRDVAHPTRAAHFVCALVLIDADGNESKIEEHCNGLIVLEERGSHGFGYDPLFYLPELNRTMAELSESEKNNISHRGKALRKLLLALTNQGE